MRTDAFLDTIRADARALADAARKDPDARVPSCPDWDVAALVGHLGFVHRWAAAIVRSGATSYPGDIETAQPGDDLVGWFTEGATDLVDLLASTPSDQPSWNHMRGEPVVGYWARRMAHETAIHRFDVQLAHGSTTPIDTELAVDGIDELVDIWLPKSLRKNPERTLGGTLHLHTTDTEGEWLIDVRDGEAHVTREHAKGDAAARGTASDLLLTLWGRLPTSTLEVFGETAILERWSDVVDT